MLTSARSHALQSGPCPCMSPLQFGTLSTRDEAHNTLYSADHLPTLRCLNRLSPLRGVLRCRAYLVGSQCLQIVYTGLTLAAAAHAPEGAHVHWRKRRLLASIKCPQRQGCCTQQLPYHAFLWVLAPCILQAEQSLCKQGGPS